MAVALVIPCRFVYIDAVPLGARVLYILLALHLVHPILESAMLSIKNYI